MKEDILKDLQCKESVLAVVLDSIFDGVYVVNQQRQILFWNRGAEKDNRLYLRRSSGKLLSR